MLISGNTQYIKIWIAKNIGIRVRAMVLSATFNNISAISFRSVLLVEEIRVHGENHHPAAYH
jgi:hypothetical protein